MSSLAQAQRAASLAKDNRSRTALLAAVSHDLRTPLASIKAAASSLRQAEVDFSPEDEASLLETIEESADRLTVLVTNLLDMSRLQSGSVVARQDPLDADSVVEVGCLAADRASACASEPGTRASRKSLETRVSWIACSSTFSKTR